MIRLLFYILIFMCSSCSNSSGSIPKLKGQTSSNNNLQKEIFVTISNTSKKEKIDTINELHSLNSKSISNKLPPIVQNTTVQPNTLDSIPLLADSIIINTYEWVFIYYMPYDNDLSEHGGNIINKIKKGIESKKIIAIIQADYNDNSGMYRYIISSDTVIKVSIKNEFSASSNSFKFYLEWIRENYNYKRSALFFLNHGGKLDEICFDETPSYSFLKIDSLAQILNSHTVLLGQKLDLLFMQVCSKGTIEAFYEFKGISNYSLASQTVMSAPNSYYTSLLKDISKSPNKTGLDVAKLICRYEKPNMFNSYTCINNSKFPLFSKKLKFLVNKLIGMEHIAMLRKPLKTKYFREEYWDLIGFLNGIDIEYDEDQKLITDLTVFIKEELIEIHKISSRSNNEMKLYSGCSISSLSVKNIVNPTDTYKHLQFYNDFKFDRLFFYD